jgi:hypothetical protein
MCFGHANYYNRASFFNHWFETPQRRLAFLEHTLAYSCCGDPHWNFSDAELSIQNKLKEMNLLLQFQLMVAESASKRDDPLPPLLLAEFLEAELSPAPTDAPLEADCDVANTVCEPKARLWA